MYTKSTTKRMLLCLFAFVIFVVAITATLLLNDLYADAVFFSALAIVAASCSTLDPLWATLLGLATGASVFALSLIFNVLFPCNLIAPPSMTVSYAGLSASFMASVLPIILMCGVCSLSARLIDKIKAISPIITSVISGFIASAILYAAEYSAAYIFLFDRFAPFEISDYESALLKRVMLFSCVTFVLNLFFGILAQYIKDRRNRVAVSESDDEEPDLEPGAELIPYRKVPTSMLLSENYFNYGDYVYDVGHTKPFANVKLVIFDMDGLIFDTERICCTCLKKALKGLGVELSDNDYLEMVGGTLPIFERVMARIAPDASVEEILRLQRQNLNEYYETHDAPIKKGFAELADHLKSHDLPMALATGSHKSLAKPLLIKAGIFDLFSFIVYGDEIERGKPAPDIYLKVLEATRTSAQQALVLEDSKNGILAASTAGINVIMIPDMIPATGKITAHCAAVCDDLGEVIKLI